MGFHHLAIATRDLEATHTFYTEAMGFTIERVSAAPTPDNGWARHVFYDTGNGEQIAFWDIHDDPTIGDFNPSISKGLGLPEWTNHIAFDAPDLDALAGARQRWLDHGWCTSIYTTDPNGIMVEFCCTTVPATDAVRADALRLLTATKPELEAAPSGQLYAPEGAPV